MGGYSIDGDEDASWFISGCKRHVTPGTALGYPGSGSSLMGAAWDVRCRESSSQSNAAVPYRIGVNR